MFAIPPDVGATRRARETCTNHMRLPGAGLGLTPFDVVNGLDEQQEGAQQKGVSWDLAMRRLNPDADLPSRGAMTHTPPLGQPPSASVAEAALASTPGLQRSMSGFGALLITLSCLSPGIGVFIVGSDVIKQAGTGVFHSFAAAALLGLAMAAIYGELASAFPGTGGEYTILGRALGPVWGVAVLFLNLLGFSIAQALSGFGVATYLAAVWPGLPTAPTAAVLVAIVTAAAVLNIRVNAAVTGAFLAVELGALGLLTALGAVHAHRSAAAVLLHPAIAAGPSMAAPGLAVLGAATAGAIYASTATAPSSS